MDKDKDQNHLSSLSSFMTGFSTAGTVGVALFVYKYSEPALIATLPAMWGWAFTVKRPKFSFKQAAAGAAIAGGVLLAGDRFIEHRLSQYDQPLIQSPHSQFVPEQQ
ncbi:MAG: hypothetical protein ACK4VI_04535 [Alphaproteobacteria bacterium]